MMPERYPIANPSRKHERPGVIAVQVAVTLVAIIGFAALTIDVGVMYNAKADLQRTADAAALAAVARLADYGQGVSPLVLARAEARASAARNPVLGRGNTPLVLEDADIEFGRAVYNVGARQYTFTPTQSQPDAVRIRVRMNSGSANGPLSLYFARVFGMHSKDLSAEAVAMMVPRDIAVVADLSASHNDDSELRHYQLTQINLFDVWAALPVQRGNNGVGNGIDPPPPGNPNHSNDLPGTFPGQPGNQGGNPDPGANPHGGQVGPTWGLMYYWGNVIDESYDPAADPGLYYRPKGQNWSDAALEAWFTSIGYSAQEVAALMSAANDSGGYWDERVAVALGMARWDSGIPGGLWQSVPRGRRQNGNGNTIVGSSELTWLVNYPFQSGSWTDYINYTSQTSSAMYAASSSFRYRLGIKTFVNYLLEERESNLETPELANAPTQPMQAVKDAVTHLVQSVYDLQSEDQLSLEIYGTQGRHQVDLRDRNENFFEVSRRLSGMQAGHYDPNTNMGAGILRAIEELHSPRANPAAKKVMILLTDGYANVACDGCTSYNPLGGRQYALDMAAQAASRGIQIFAVSVGANSDQALMDSIAQIGGGAHFHAEGDISQYSIQLDEIFQRLGGRRPIQLIR